MAAWPCQRCDQRFKGEAANVYLTRYYGDQAEMFRYVLCVPCADDLVGEWRVRALYRGEDGEWEIPEDDNATVPRLAPPQPQGRASKRLRGQREV